MAELFLSPPEPFEARVSPAAALVLTLPLVELAARFPGVDPWLRQLSGRLGPRARADIRLLTVPLSGVLSYLLDAPLDEESLEPALRSLREAEAESIHARVLDNLAHHLHEDRVTVDRLLSAEPERVRELMQGMEGPSADETFAFDTERALELLRDPPALKALAELRLGQLWHDHFAVRWREALPTARRLAAMAERRFVLREPRKVLQSIVGTNDPERVEWLAGQRLVFCAVPFLGPYVARAGTTPERGASASRTKHGEDGSRAQRPEDYGSLSSLAGQMFIGFGIVRDDGGDAAPSDELALRDMLLVLQALADEGRLRAVAHVRDYKRACAADFMREFGWSQPATSRHLRALESTGLLDTERIDGVKWYTLNPQRAYQVVQALERFLSGTPERR